MPFASVALSGVSKSFGPKIALDDITFTLGPQTRMGVVGRNGSGKSTLLKMIAGVWEPDSGSVTYMPPSASIGYLAQILDRDDRTVDQFLEDRAGVRQAAEDLETTAMGLADGTAASADAYEAALDRYTSSGASDFDARVVGVLADVGLDEEFRSQAMNTLSGGQAAKVSLASILLSRFDLLLLDEPTNDLDFRGLQLLEKFVLQSQAGMLLVSHDRAFVEATTNSILEIDEHSHTAREFGGGWEAYERERNASRSQDEHRHEVYQTQRGELRARAQQQRQWAETGASKGAKDNDKMAHSFSVNKTEKQASKARATEKAIARMDVVEKPWEGWNLQMKLTTTKRAGDVVAKLDNAVIERGNFRLGPISVEVGWAERIAIVGPNGAGKTTLLSALLGELPLASGNQYLGPGVVLGRIDRLRSLLKSDQPLVDVFINASELLPPEARPLLAKFDLTADHVQRSSSSLSPGEQTRALLALLMSKGTNCLVLDEPTNHLDIEAIEQLEAALETYDGTLLLITHDRRMLDAVTVTRTIEL